MKIHRLFCCLFLLLPILERIEAQTPFCGASVFWQNALAGDSSLAEKQLLQNEAAHKFFQDNSQPDFAGNVVTLPVVVHLMHNNGPENLSDNAVQQAIQTLNDAFANAGFYDQGSGTDVQIRFCLATRTPDGAATTGINRVQTTLTNLVLEDNDGQLKNLIRWDPTRYINIWLVRSICSTAWGCNVYGYATQPPFHGSAADGIVLEAAFFKGTPANSSPAAHEMGHYLGLYHTFEGGCTNNDCLTDGDRVCDTPPDQSTAGIPCGQTVNTCSTDTQSGLTSDLPDDTKNFMDYGNLACQNDFSPGQGDRMNFFVQNARQSLLASDGCGQPCPNLVTAAFTPSVVVADLSSSVSFTNQSQNANSYAWTLNGVPFSSSASPAYVFNQVGAYTIELTAISADPALCPSQTATAIVQVVCPARANFLSSNLEVFSGGSVLLTNTSQGATQFEWFINGVSQGANLSGYTFPEAGSYSITLEAGNGACVTSKTLTITVQDSCKGLSFQKIFGTANDERGVASLALSDGNYLIGGDGDVPGAGRDLLFVKTDLDGNVLWTKRFGSNGDEYLQYLSPKTGGGFIATFTGTGWNGLTEAAVAAFDNDANLLWQRRLVSLGGSELRRLHPTKDGGYIACGYVRSNPSDALANAYFLKLDASGNQQWARAYSLPGQSAFATGIVGAGDTVFMASGYTQQPGGLRDILMMQIKPNGDLQLARSTPSQGLDRVLWDIGVSNSAPGSPHIFSGAEKGYLGSGEFSALTINTNLTLTAASDNHYVSAAHPSGFHDILVQNNGDIVLPANALETNDSTLALLYFSSNNFANTWTQSYAGKGNSKVGQVSASPDGGYLLTGFTASGADRDMFWLKTGSTGLAGDCASQPITLEGSGPTTTLLNVPLAAAAVLPWETALGPVVQPYDLASAQLCPASCATLPCKTAWTLYFEEQGNTNSLSAIVPAPDGTFYAAGTRNNRTILLNFSPDGALLWSRIFHFSTRNDRLLDLSIDSDGMLVGVGNVEQATIVFAGFAFKYDPVANVVLWVKEEPQNKLSRFTNIAEIAPGGNYLVNGIYPTGASTGDPDYDPVLMELDRNTGDLVAGAFGNAFDLDKNEEFLAIKQHNGAIYAVGKAESTPLPNSARTPVVVKFDPSGNVLWSRKIQVPSITVLYLEASDIVFDGDSMLISLHGRFDTTPGILSSQIALTKIAPDGAVLWTQLYTIDDVNSSTTNIYAQNLALSANGYLILTRESLLKTDKNGNLQWARHTFGKHDSGREMLLEKNGSVYVVGKSLNPTGFFLARYQSSNGDVGGICGQDLGLNISTAELPDLSTYTFDWLSYASPLLLQANNAAPDNVQLSDPYYPCGAPCMEICNNGVSDDYDYLIDCLDPTCTCPDCHGERARIWYFGTHAGLDFSTDPPTVLTDGATDAEGSTSVACDPGGRLLFYSDGKTLFNRNHLPMPNGAGLNGSSSSLGNTIIPLVPPLFSAFNANESAPFQQYYSVVDMAANQGRGDIYKVTGLNFKNVLAPSTPLAEKIASVHICTGLGPLWLVNKTRNDDGFLISVMDNTTSSLVASKMAYIGRPAMDGNGDNHFGQMKFNHAGTQLVNALPGSGGFDLIEFNPFDGTMPGVVTVILPELAGAYGLEFSPDDRFLYLSTPLRVYQFDLSSGNATAIANSRVLLTQQPSPRFGAMQIGPNGKIYVATGRSAPSDALDVIFYPNQPGLACQYQENAQSLGPGRVHYGLPYFPQQVVTPQNFVKISGPDSLCGVPSEGIWTLNTPLCNGADSLSWTLLGDTVLPITPDTLYAHFEQPGEYQLIVRAVFACGVSVDTFPITVTDNKPPLLDLGPDLKVCENGVFTLHAGGGFARYRWQDGRGDSTLSTSFPGKYWVTVWDACGNKQSDTIRISIDPGTQIDLGPNRVACRVTGTSFERPAAFSSWQWSPPAALDCDTCGTVTVHPFTVLNYVVVAQNAEGCLSTDTVRITPETLMVFLDTVVCPGAPFLYLGATLPAADTTLVLNLLTPDGCDLKLTAVISTWLALTVTLPPDTTLKIGALLPLPVNALGSGALSYAWWPPDGLSCTDCPSPVAEALTDITYQVMVTDDNGCVDTAAISLKVNELCSVQAPTAFTPDGDGTNDSFYLLTDPCVRLVRSIRVFSRWGQEVYIGVNLPPNDGGFAWDGRVKGRDLPSDVYLWTAEVVYFDGRLGSFKGEVTLLR